MSINTEEKEKKTVTLSDLKKEAKMFQAYGKQVPIVPLIQKIHSDKDAYANAKGLRGKKRQEFYAALEDVTTGIHNGTLSRNVSNVYEDTTGKMQHRKQGKDGLTYALNYVDTLVNTYKAPEEKKKTIPQYNWNNFLEFVQNSISPGQEAIQTKAWLEGELKNEDGTYQTANREKKFKTIVQNYTNQLSDDFDYSTFGGKQAVVDKLTNLYNAEFNNLRTAAAQVGIGDASFDALFGVGKVTDPKDAKSAAAQQLAEVKAENDKVETEIQTEEDLAVEKNRQKILGYRTGKPSDTNTKTLLYQGIKDYTHPFFNLTMDSRVEENDFEQRLLNLTKNLENTGWFDTDADYNSFRMSTPLITDEKAKKGDYLAHIYRYLYDNDKESKSFTETLDDGTEILLVPESMDLNQGTFLYYDPKDHALYKEYFVNNGKKLLQKYQSQLLQKKALGGVLKAADGTKTTNKYTAFQQAQKRRKVQEKQLAKQRAEEAEAEKRKPKDQDLMELDHLQMYALGLDLISTVSSIIPGVGSVASVGTGLAGTIASAISDFNNDSVSGWEATGNLLFGLGMDALGIIPVAGTAAKAGKVVKTLKVALPILASLPAVSRHSEIIASAEKMCTDWDSMTNQDWSNIGVLAKLLVGGTGLAKNVHQSNKIVKHAAAQGTVQTPETFKLKTKSGKEFELSKDEYIELGKTKTAAEAEATIGKLNEKRTQAGLEREKLLLGVDVGKKHSIASKTPGVKNSDWANQHDLELLHTPARQGYDFTDAHTVFDWRIGKLHISDPRTKLLEKSLNGTPYFNWNIPSRTTNRLNQAAQQRLGNTQTPAHKQGGILKAQSGMAVPPQILQPWQRPLDWIYPKINPLSIKSVVPSQPPAQGRGMTAARVGSQPQQSSKPQVAQTEAKPVQGNGMMAKRVTGQAPVVQQAANTTQFISPIKAGTAADLYSPNVLQKIKTMPKELDLNASLDPATVLSGGKDNSMKTRIKAQFEKDLEKKTSGGDGNVTDEEKKGTNWAGIAQGATTLFGTVADIISNINTRKANKEATNRYVDSLNELTMAKLKPEAPEKPNIYVFDPTADYNYNALVHKSFALGNNNLTADPYLNRAQQNERWNQLLGFAIARNTANAQQMAEKFANSQQINYENALSRYNTAYDNKQIIGMGNFTAEQARIQNLLQNANDKNDLLAKLFTSGQSLAGQSLQNQLDLELARATTEEERRAIANKYKGILMPYNPGTWQAKSGGKVAVAKIKRKTDLDKLESKEKLEKMKLRDKKSARVSKMNAKLILKMLDI